MKKTCVLAVAVLAACGGCRLRAQPVIVPSTGYLITWNGNDGDFFTSANPALVPDNLTLAAHGAAAFSASQLGPQLGLGFHLSGNLNDGIYGNANSWIGGDGDIIAAAGVAFGAEHPINRLAFGRDNGNDDTEGQLANRSLGLCTLQFTRAANVGLSTADTQDPATGWATLGTANYFSSQDTVPGGGFTSYLRHEYGISTSGGDPIQATGIRLLVPAAGLGAGTALDEIEVYAVPEPGTILLLVLGLCGLPRLRRRRGQSVASLLCLRRATRLDRWPGG